MADDAVVMANARVNVVPAVLSLANPPWQQEVWLDRTRFENIDHIFHVLFDDFCDADNPGPYLGTCLRTGEEVALIRELGTALGAANDESPNGTDEEFLASASWPTVVAVAGRLARVMVSNDLAEIVALHEARAARNPVPPSPRRWLPSRSHR